MKLKDLYKPFSIKVYEISVGPDDLNNHLHIFYSINLEIRENRHLMISGGSRSIRIGLWTPKQKISSATAIDLINHLTVENDQGLRLFGRPATIEELVACEKSLYLKLRKIKLLALGEVLNAGIALYEYGSGQPVGFFCVKDTQPRDFSLEEIVIFMDLASRAEKEVNNKE